MTISTTNRSAEEQFDLFCLANSFEDILNHFNQLCAVAVSNPLAHPWNIYKELEGHLRCYWKAANLFDRLNKRAAQKEYLRQTACNSFNVLVIGAGPCGLRCAIELALLGARVVVIEKRSTFSRNNVLHLWPYLINDLRALGAKTFFGKFCAGSIDHVSIRTLQCILLKAALLFGVQVFPGLTYTGLIEPDGAFEVSTSPSSKPSEQNRTNFSTGLTNGAVRGCDRSPNRATKQFTSTDSRNGAKKTSITLNGSVNGHDNLDDSDDLLSEGSGDRTVGWRVKVNPEVHALKDFEFDILIGADGRRSCLGFPSKKLKCRLAIAVTANFINYHTPEEAQVQEISGVASIFNQQFFANLTSDTGIDLENIVYYKDETHYFVMTAKKHSLLAKGVLKHDREDTKSLLSAQNVNAEALQAYARETANYVTDNKLPHLDFASNARGKPDVEVFDFTRMFACEHSCRILEQKRHLLMQFLIGDGLYEPFWPTGSGCALGFLSAMDAAWAVSRLAAGFPPLQVIAERESIYQRLSQTTAQNMPTNFAEYTLDPRTRYVRCNLTLFTPMQVRGLYLTDQIMPVRSQSVRLQKKSTKDSSTQSMYGPNDRTSPPTALSEASENRTILFKRTSIYPNLGVLRWLQFRLAYYYGCGLIDAVSDLRTSHWNSGIPLLCLIHLHQPDLVPELRDFFAADSDKRDPTMVFSTVRADNNLQPDLVRACDLLVQHFNVSLPVGLQATVYPRCDTEWSDFLFHVYKAMGSTPMVLGTNRPTDTFCNGLSTPQILKTTPTTKVTNVLVRRSSSPSTVAAPKMDTSPKPKQKITNGVKENAVPRSHGNPSNRSHHEDANLAVEKGLLSKRRAELVNNLTGPSVIVSDRRRSPPRARSHNSSRPTMLPERDSNRQAKPQHKEKARTRTLSNAANEAAEYDPIRAKDVVVKQLKVPGRVADLYAPPKGSSYCYICSKHLYSNDRITAFGLFFHRGCFRCSKCGTQLTVDTASCSKSQRFAYPDKFYCLTHAGFDTDANAKKTVPKSVPSHGTASLLSRLQAGEFPFSLSPHNPSNAGQQINGRQMLSAEKPPVGAGTKITPLKYPKSALLIGLNEPTDDDSVMGVVPVRNLFNRIDNHQVESSSGSSGSHFPDKRMGAGHHKPKPKLQSSFDMKGVRDEPTPSSNCYLAGHLGLPEVVRRANYELNVSSTWSGFSLPDVLDHMRMLRANMQAAEEYFASSESGDGTIPYESVFKVDANKKDSHSHLKHFRRTTGPRNTSNPQKNQRLANGQMSTSFGESKGVTTLTPTQNILENSVSDSSLRNISTIGTLNNTNSLFTSPVHRPSSNLEAKQRFCMEPPKPLMIDPVRFIGSKNNERTIINQLDDCSEQVEVLTDPDIRQSSIVNSGPNHFLSGNNGPVSVIQDPIQALSLNVKPFRVICIDKDGNSSAHILTNDKPSIHRLKDKSPIRKTPLTTPVGQPFSGYGDIPHIDDVPQETESSILMEAFDALYEKYDNCDTNSPNRRISPDVDKFTVRSPGAYDNVPENMGSSGIYDSLIDSDPALTQTLRSNIFAPMPGSGAQPKSPLRTNHDRLPNSVSSVSSSSDDLQSRPTIRPSQRAGHTVAGATNNHIPSPQLPYAPQQSTRPRTSSFPNDTIPSGPLNYPTLPINGKRNNYSSDIRRESDYEHLTRSNLNYATWSNQHEHRSLRVSINQSAHLFSSSKRLI